MRNMAIKEWAQHSTEPRDKVPIRPKTAIERKAYIISSTQHLKEFPASDEKANCSFFPCDLSLVFNAAGKAPDHLKKRKAMCVG